MDVFLLLDTLKKNGIQLYREGDQLKVKATPGTLTPELLDKIRVCKHELLALFIQNDTVHKAIVKAMPSSDYPVTYMQRSIWMLSQEEEASVAYNMPLVLHIHEELEKDTLEQAFEDMIARHELLRTCFLQKTSDDIRQKPVSINFQLQLQDVSDATESELQQLIGEESMQPFALDKAPLWRARLLRKSTDNYILLFTIHHIICDGLSLDILRNELFAAYYERKAGGKTFFEELSHNFYDYATSQQQDGIHDGWKKEENYWHAVLQSDWPVWQLNNVLQRPAVKTYAGKRCSKKLPFETQQALQLYCTKKRISFFTGLVSMLNLLFFKYTSITDLVTGLVVSGREQLSWQHIVGPFINTIPLRTKIDAGWNVDELLQKQKQILEDALSHQNIPFGYLVEKLNRKKDISRSAIFDVLVVFNEDTSQHQMISDQQDSRTTSQFDITFSFSVSSNGVSADIEYNTDIYDPAFIERFWQHYCNLISNAMLQPHKEITKVSFLSSDEWQQVLYSFNDTRRSYALHKTVLHLIEETIQRNPDRMAIVGSDRSFTYREMWMAVIEVAWWINNEAVTKRSGIIGVQLTRSEWLPVVLLAVWRSGNAYVPIDTAYPQERIDYIIRDSECAFVITDEWLHDKLTGIIAKKQSLPVALSPNDCAYIIYTSGSTGYPKGVMISHRNVSAFINWAVDEFKSSSFEYVYAVTSHCFDLSVFELFYTLVAGKTIRLLPTAMYIKEYLRNDTQVMLNTVPSVVQYFINDPDFPWQRLSCLNLAGEPMPAVCKELLYNEHLELRNLYGPTETTTYSTSYRFISVNEPVTIGAPIANTQIYILDRYGQPVPVGINGEIYISGEGVATGYKNRKELTMERFIDNPWMPGARMFKTGDIGRWSEDGNIIYVGREDHQVKLRGYRIECGEIEQVLERTGLVNKAIVTVQQINAEEVLVAYVTTNSNIEAHALHSLLQHQLPAFMVPHRYVFLDTFPLTANGKINRLALTSYGSGPSIIKQITGPRNAEEIAICQAWQEVLQHSDFGIHDNFFEAGGNSLHVFRLQALLKKRVGLDVKIRFYFENLTVALQAAELQKHKAVYEEPIPVSTELEQYPLNGFQKRVWALCNGGAGKSYHIPGGLVLKGPLNINALQEALIWIVSRHELLRSVFHCNEQGELYRKVLPVNDLFIEIEKVDLTASQSIEDIAHAQFNKEFSLQRSLPFRVTLVKEQPDLHYLLFCLHHIVCDGWSLVVIQNELLHAYSSRFQRNNIDLPALPVQFKDFVAWNKNQHLSKNEAFWKQYLGYNFPLFQLPAEYPKPVNRTYTGKRIRKSIPSGIYSDLKGLCKENNVTVFTGLISSLYLLLWRYGNQDDIVMGTVVAGREHTMLQNMVGPLLNTVPVHFCINKGISFKAMMHAMHERLMNVYEHQEYPYENMLGWVNENGQPGRNSLFDMVVAWQNQQQPGLHHDVEALLQGTGLQVQPYDTWPGEVSQMDATFIFQEHDDTLELYLEYDSGIFAAQFMQRLMNNYEQVLRQVINNPGITVGDCEVMTVEEKNRVTRTVNDVACPYPAASLKALFEEQVTKFADNIAINFNGTQLTYDAFNRLCNQFAAFLQTTCGVLENERICVQLSRSEKLFIAIFGILKLGCAYVPIDPRYPQERIDFMIKDSACRLTVHDALMEEFNTVKDQFSYDNSTLNISAEQLAYVIYTSGSTGSPKGVAVTHGNVVPLVKNSNLVTFSPQDVVLQWANYAFDGSVFEIFGALLNGASLVLLTENEVSAIITIKKRIYEYKVSIMFVTPALFNVIVDTDVTTLLPLRKLVIGGDILSIQHARKALDHMGPNKIINGYGPTETTVFATFYELNNLDDPAMSIPIGKPLSNNAVYILDDSRHLLPQGAIGEIYIGGSGVARGYLNDPERTIKKFIPDPFSSGKLYRTGDIGRWREDGTLAFLGRIDHQVKIRGHRVELGEIEYCLKKMNGVLDAIVLLKGEASEDKFLCAYIAGTVIGEETIRDSMRSLLPDYMLPACYVFLDKLPLTHNGKVDRRMLPEPSRKQALEKRVLKEQQDAVETAIGELWKKILQAENITKKDIFARLGGHSLKAGILFAEIKKMFGAELSIPQLLYASLEEQALLVKRSASAINKETSNISLPDRYPLSHQQLSLFMADLFRNRAKQFHIQIATGFKGDLYIPALKKAIGLLIKKHDMLRSVYGLNENGEAIQWVKDEIDYNEIWSYINLSDETEPYIAAEAHIHKLSQQPLDLQTGPLFKAYLIKCSVHEFVLVFHLHHIVSDAWGLNIIRKDLLTFYSACVNNSYREENYLPGPRFRDYILLQRELLQSDAGKQMKIFWEEQLGKKPVLLNLHDDTLVKEQSGDVVQYSIPHDLFTELKELALESRSGLFVVSLTALNLLLFAYTRQTDIIVGCPFSGRLQAGTSELVGCLVNILPVRNIFREENTISEVLVGINQSMEACFNNQLYPASLLNDFLKRQHSIDITDIYKISINYLRIEATGQNIKLPNADLQVLESTTTGLVNKYDLNFVFNEYEEELLLLLEYNPEKFSRSFVEQAGKKITYILSLLTRKPGTKVETLLHSIVEPI